MSTLLLLPGLASDETLWRGIADPLAAAARGPVHVTDAHGRFATLPEMAAALLAEHAGPLALAGTSMGGILALEVLRQAPQRVQALALLGTTARPDTPEMLALRREAVGLFEAGRMDEVLRANLPFAFHPSAPARLPNLVGDYLAMVRRAGAAQLARQNRAIMARADSRGLLATIRCPLLVACGDSDVLTPPECSEEIAAAVPQARFERLVDCGHLLTMEQPERVAALLLDWRAEA
ncbi:alpha/beta fold hydrolase [Aquincola sp. S2]|uniref:Alpha/beta fold hydrolase n=1 Tax=Pseudaquabacterium terrae TaxID=2732868 RepID=A0ABX2EB33_9BURK|nr:alpha/beta fold hydrolase [Aquabacterium terrae]NRF66320.1 alpha/beta fold hydrolase [Aquabacterium terrae]